MSRQKNEEEKRGERKRKGRSTAAAPSMPVNLCSARSMPHADEAWAILPPPPLFSLSHSAASATHRLGRVGASVGACKLQKLLEQRRVKLAVVVRFDVAALGAVQLVRRLGGHGGLQREGGKGREEDGAESERAACERERMGGRRMAP